MNEVVEFPKKIFTQWGALAQELASSLSLLGATKAEVKEITARLELKWEAPGTTPAMKALRSVSRLPADGEAAEPEAARGDRAPRMCAYWKSQSARTLLELARYEYQHAPAH